MMSGIGCLNWVWWLFFLSNRSNLKPSPRFLGMILRWRSCPCFWSLPLWFARSYGSHLVLQSCLEWCFCVLGVWFTWSSSRCRSIWSSFLLCCFSMSFISFDQKRVLFQDSFQIIRCLYPIPGLFPSWTVDRQNVHNSLFFYRLACGDRARW